MLKYKKVQRCNGGGDTITWSSPAAHPRRPGTPNLGGLYGRLGGPRPRVKDCEAGRHSGRTRCNIFIARFLLVPLKMRSPPLHPRRPGTPLLGSWLGPLIIFGCLTVLDSSAAGGTANCRTHGNLARAICWHGAGFVGPGRPVGEL